MINYSNEGTNTSISEIKKKKISKFNGVTKVKNEICNESCFKGGFYFKENDCSNNIPFKESSKSNTRSFNATSNKYLNPARLFKPFGGFGNLGELSPSLCPVSPMNPFPSFNSPLNFVSNLCQFSQFPSCCSPSIQNGTSLLSNKRVRHELIEPSSQFSFYGGFQISRTPSQQYFIL